MIRWSGKYATVWPKLPALGGLSSAAKLAVITGLALLSRPNFIHAQSNPAYSGNALVSTRRSI